MKQSLIVFLTVFLTVNAFAQGPKTKRTLRFITHEASPLMDSKLPGGGAFVDSLRIVMRKAGYEMDVIFVSSWARAKIMAKNDKTIDGYFPYTTKENENIFAFSDYFVEDPWVIIERKDSPIVWNKVQDLVKYTAGNVTGVELRPGVKELAEAGKLRVENTSSDVYNLQKLANKRVDIVFMDLFVFHNNMANNPQVQAFKDKLQVNPKPLVVSKYGIAVRKSKASKEFLIEFNKISHETIRYVMTYGDRVNKKIELPTSPVSAPNK